MKTIIEPHIANYIDVSVQKVRQEISLEIKEYKIEIKKHMTELRDGFREEIKMGFEAADMHMREIARETTREVIREEVPGIVRKELKMFLTPA